MGIRERIARAIAPGLRNEAEVRDIVQEEIARAKMAVPFTVNYDPNNEGYRPMSGTLARRDLSPVDQTRMFEIAYFMWDSSPMFRRLARMDKTFLFGEPVTVTSDEEDVQEIIDRHIETNRLTLDFPDNTMWLSILGEQCWPADVNPQNGLVTMGYVDPAFISDVHLLRTNVRQAVRVDLMGMGGRPGQKMSVVRKDPNPASATYGRMVGDVFFYRINNPPNSPRGRSDFLTLFDWIDSLERNGYNSLERVEFLFNFVWDVQLKGMNEEQISDWLRNNPPPQPGSIRAHNEQVEWDAVAPDLKSADFAAGFETIKSFVMGSAGRPDSWFGAGGKAYQTEAEQFGQVPIKDLDERQQLIGNIYEEQIRFAVDQAVIAGRLSPEKAAAGFTVNLPEISKKDFSKVLNSIPQVTTALALAEQSNWITRKTAAGLFALAAAQMGMEIDVDAEMESMGDVTGGEPDVTEDYE